MQSQPLSVAGEAPETRARGSALLYRLQHPAQSLVRSFIRMLYRNRVVSGPFRGMWYGPRSYSERPCVLGTYELELHPTLETLLERSFDRVIDVGAGCGYYAAGLAYRLPQAQIIAYEADAGKHPALTANLQANQVENRVTVLGICSPGDFEQHLSGARRSLLVMDVEGAEVDLLTPEAVRALRKTTILLETHEGLVPGSIRLIRERLTGSHHIQEIVPHTRKLEHLPSGIRNLTWLGANQALLDSVSEHRSVQTGWLVMEPRS
jgi:hypothetical protein